jgi:hypothetical protein
MDGLSIPFSNQELPWQKMKIKISPTQHMAQARIEQASSALF